MANDTDGEADGQPNANALGDDGDGYDDEQGVSFPEFVHGVSSTYTVHVNSPGGLASQVEIWIDLDRNGAWAASELIFNQSLASGTYTPSYTVPVGSGKGPTFARCRISTAGTGSPKGAAADGDLDGSGNGYQVTNAGHLVVERWPECPKWVQPPDCEIGVDLRSHGVAEQGVPPPYLIADDWLCDGRPITGIRWWGSYIGYHDAPEPAPQSQRPIGFVLRWFEDVPVGPEAPYSRPGEEITNIVVQLTPYGTSYPPPGAVTESYYCSSDTSWMSPFPSQLPSTATNEHEYMYHVVLPEPWNEKDGSVYWLSVQALYDPTQRIEYAWGWKTTAPAYNWNDDAVVAEAMLPQWQELEYPPAVAPWGGVTNWPYEGASVNMAFDLLTDVCPRRAKKWRQPPDMSNGMDTASFAPSGQVWTAGWPLRADDFVSDGRLISDLHWWGSYLGWQSQTNEAVQPPSAPSESLLGFEIGWHADVPAGSVQRYSMPTNPPLKRIFVPIGLCHEVYYGSIFQQWLGVYEHEYQYYVDLLNPRIDDPWPEEEDGIYWLSIQAVFPPAWTPEQSQTHRGWGWVSTHPSNNWNDISVLSTNTTASGPEWKPGEYMPGTHPWAETNAELNLAFELTTDEVGPSPWHDPISLHKPVDVGAGWMDVPSVGDMGAGVQILQVTSTLTNSNSWLGVQTNILPLPPPYTNWWYWHSGGNTSEFYRVLQQ